VKDTASLSVGEVVQVASREEILRTLDKDGRLEGLPFMPEMFAFCGRRMRVFRRAHKTCDTTGGADNTRKGRRMSGAVHLEGARCDGSAHGHCEAGCLMFWKEAWLKRVPEVTTRSPESRMDEGVRMKERAGCTETQVHAGTQRTLVDGTDGPRYVCQATEILSATRPLAWWVLRQYAEDVTSGNVGVSIVVRGLLHRGYENLINAGIGVGALLRWLYDLLHTLWGGLPYPHRSGFIPIGDATPTAKLDLQSGEVVRVKAYEEILATCDRANKNRGMRFDAEMVPYCGGTYRVLKRVTRIIDEMTGGMQVLSNACIILDGVVCQARYSECRLFCPRSVYPFWREIWLERIRPETTDASVEDVTGLQNVEIRQA
jgi:hypothetical protein